MEIDNDGRFGIQKCYLQKNISQLSKLNKFAAFIIDYSW